MIQNTISTVSRPKRATKFAAVAETQIFSAPVLHTRLLNNLVSRDFVSKLSTLNPVQRRLVASCINGLAGCDIPKDASTITETEYTQRISQVEVSTSDSIIATLDKDVEIEYKEDGYHLRIGGSVVNADHQMMHNMVAIHCVDDRKNINPSGVCINPFIGFKGNAGVGPTVIPMLQQVAEEYKTKHATLKMDCVPPLSFDISKYRKSAYTGLMAPIMKDIANIRNGKDLEGTVSKEIEMFKSIVAMHRNPVHKNNRTPFSIDHPNLPGFSRYDRYLDFLAAETPMFYAPRSDPEVDKEKWPKSFVPIKKNHTRADWLIIELENHSTHVDKMSDQLKRIEKFGTSFPGNLIVYLPRQRFSGRNDYWKNIYCAVRKCRPSIGFRVHRRSGNGSMLLLASWGNQKPAGCPELMSEAEFADWESEREFVPTPSYVQSTLSKMTYAAVSMAYYKFVLAYYGINRVFAFPKVQHNWSNPLLSTLSVEGDDDEFVHVVIDRASSTQPKNIPAPAEGNEEEDEYDDSQSVHPASGRSSNTVSVVQSHSNQSHSNAERSDSTPVNTVLHSIAADFMLYQSHLRALRESKSPSERDWNQKEALRMAARYPSFILMGPTFSPQYLHENEPMDQVLDTLPPKSVSKVDDHVHVSMPSSNSMSSQNIRPTKFSKNRDVASPRQNSGQRRKKAPPVHYEDDDDGDGSEDEEAVSDDEPEQEFNFNAFPVPVEPVNVKVKPKKKSEKG